MNAKEKRPKLQCLRRFLSLSGLSKKDVFANFYGSFEPEKINIMVIGGILTKAE